jgi:hypothetical protein
MARELNPTRNVLEIDDKISGSVLSIYYVMPSNPDRVAYSNAFFERKGSKVVAKADSLGIKASFGAKIVAGFEKGAFTLDGKIISSDSSDPDYFPDWKKFMSTSAMDVLAYLATTVFEALARPVTPLDFEIEDLAKPEEPEVSAPEEAAPAQSDPAASPPAQPQEEGQADPLSQP